jgi:hypothetical protein
VVFESSMMMLTRVSPLMMIFSSLLPFAPERLPHIEEARHRRHTRLQEVLARTALSVNASWFGWVNHWPHGNGVTQYEIRPRGPRVGFGGDQSASREGLFRLGDPHVPRTESIDDNDKGSPSRGTMSRCVSS